MKKLLILLLLFTGLTKSQIYTPKDVEICDSVFKLASQENLQNKDLGDIIVAVGESFIGTKYAAHTLERGNKEKLVIDLRGMDCTTFIENTLALAKCIKNNKTAFKDFENQLLKIRYRNGIIKDYSSRLNYFSDWIYDNEKKGIIKNISESIGGVPVIFKVDFMSSHPGSYKRLKENPSLIHEIKKQEQEISGRTYYYIPEKQIAAAENKIQNGDLIAFATNIKGLDITHVGIAVKTSNGGIHLLHAPDVGYKVQISDLSLTAYITKIKKDTGIIVLRSLN